MKLCDYGCGKEAKYQFKNGKWCCEITTNKCLAIKNKNSKSRKGQIPWNKGIPRTEKTKIKIGNQNRGKKKPARSKEHRRKLHEINKGKNNPMFGKNCSESTKRKIRNSLKITIDQIQKKYPLFSQIEKMRYNPDKPEEKEIQVHCHNHNCLNSKEKGGWFTPIAIQLSDRIRAIHNPHGFGESNFYCSEECKKECPLFNLKSDPCKNTETPYTNKEYQTFRKFVLERDDYICQFCGDKATHVHHERPQKLEPFFALDPDLAWSCCEKCHFKYGHKTGSSCSTGNLASKIC